MKFKVGDLVEILWDKVDLSYMEDGELPPLEERYTHAVVYAVLLGSRWPYEVHLFEHGEYVDTRYFIEDELA